MSIFGSIRDAIFGRARAAPAQAQSSAMPQLQPQQQQQTTGAGLAGAGAQAGVDVDAVLESAAAAKSGKLNYRSSIVDLMKVLDLDPSLDNRKALASELGYTGAKDGSAEMNIWLHRRVIEELEKNGGRVSAALKA